MKKESLRKISLYKESLQQKSDRDLAFVERQIEHCEHIEDRKEYCICLRSRGLTLKQIAVLESVSPQMVHKVINRE